MSYCFAERALEKDVGIAEEIVGATPWSSRHSLYETLQHLLCNPLQLYITPSTHPLDSGPHR
jgi:hypothetical protein